MTLFSYHLTSKCLGVQISLCPAGPTTLRPSIVVVVSSSSVCGQFENDSISASRTTRFHFVNDSISDPPGATDEFRLYFLSILGFEKTEGGLDGRCEGTRTGFGLSWLGAG